MAKLQKVIIWHDEKDLFSVKTIKERQQKNFQDLELCFWAETDINQRSISQVMEIFEHDLDQSDVIVFFLNKEFSGAKYHKNRKLLNLFDRAKSRGVRLVAARTYLRTMPEHPLFNKYDIYQHDNLPLCDHQNEVVRQNLDEFLVFLRSLGLNSGSVEITKDNPDNSIKNSKTIFISHSSKQKASADDLHFMLETAGYNPILDSYDIAAGQNISERIATLIKESKYFILLLTEESLSSSWVLCEITLAYSTGLIKNERLLPIQLSAIDDKLANSIQWIPRNSYNWLDGTKGLRSVVDWLKNK